MFQTFSHWLFLFRNPQIVKEDVVTSGGESRSPPIKKRKLNPLNRGNSEFVSLEGIVDTFQ